MVFGKQYWLKTERGMGPEGGRVVVSTERKDSQTDFFWRSVWLEKKSSSEKGLNLQPQSYSGGLNHSGHLEQLI